MGTMCRRAGAAPDWTLVFRLTVFEERRYIGSVFWRLVSSFPRAHGCQSEQELKIPSRSPVLSRVSSCPNHSGLPKSASKGKRPATRTFRYHSCYLQTSILSTAIRLLSPYYQGILPRSGTEGRVTVGGRRGQWATGGAGSLFGESP